MSANKVIHVDLAQKDVEVHAVEKSRKRKIADEYDVNDPFFQEDAVPDVEHTECKYENFYCIAGERLVPADKKREKKKEHKIKKEKRESTRQKFQDEKDELLGLLGGMTAAELEESLPKLAILEILTAQEVSPAAFLSAIAAQVDSEQFKRVKPLAEQLLTKEAAGAVLEQAVRESQALQAEIKAEIETERQRADELFPDDPTDGKYGRMQFDEQFIEKLCQYTEKEYLVFYFNLYLAGKKRVLEYGVKKNIFCQLQSFFPASYGNIGSLGKKIASYIVKKRNKRLPESDKLLVPGATQESADPLPDLEEPGASQAQAPAGSLAPAGATPATPTLAPDTFPEEFHGSSFSGTSADLSMVPPLHFAPSQPSSARSEDAALNSPELLEGESNSSDEAPLGEATTFPE